MSEGEAARPKRRRIRRVLLVLAILLVLFVLLAPALAARFAKGAIEDALEASLAVDATVGDVSVSLLGAATVEGVRLVDDRGRDVGGLERAEASLALLRALGGTYAFDATVWGLELRLFEEEDGAWSAKDLPRAKEDDDAEPAGDPRAPALVGTAALRDARVVLVRRDGSEVRAALDADLTLDGPDGPARLAGEIDVAAGAGAPSALSGTVAGSVRGLVALLGGAGEAVVEDLSGELVYVPDRVAASLGPLLPGELTGAEPEPCRFQLAGRVRALDADALARGLTGTVDLGVGRYRHAGLDVAGEARLALEDGRATLASDLRANGGDLRVGGEVALGAGGGALTARDVRVTLDATDVAANSRLGPLLGYVHPILGGAAGLDGVAATELEGAITCDVDLRYAGALDVATLAEGWDALPKEPIEGTITFALDAASIAGSPLVEQLLGELDLGGGRDLTIEPIELEVAAGRVAYAHPWPWTVRGARTTFGGSVGLDRTLDLVWSIPVTGDVVARNDFLEPLRGRTLELPIRGTITRPELVTEGLLADVARDVLKDELEEALDSLRGQAGDDGGPAALLKRADDLWRAGDKPAAAELYRRIRAEHKVSLVYALNRDRIKERASWKP